MEELTAVLEFEIFSYKDFSLTVFNIGVVVATYVFTWLFLKLFHLFINRSIKRRDWMERSTLYALEKLAAYFAYTLATAIALETIGIDLTIVLAGSAALLVGVGLGIQQIFNDFTSGLILLFGGTVKVNDIVEFNNTVGRIIEIDFRTSKIKTRDGITIIVPNSKLVSDNVINWTTMDDLTRFHIKVGVAYGSDTALVRSILTEVSKKHPAVDRTLPVKVQFKNFGDSSLDFEVYFWARNSWEIEFVKSEMRFEIDEEFRKNNVRIPFPQRDVHLFNKP
ncbi:mechanosensitive ion channel [Salibacteraceae bacterium]|jgi:small-conductance mechanosensitive channel|nr:mechanosensitive ion channel [Salibacteraceae bacterium]MDB9709021.1 mechanosensitive ion channel [Salibacteraceae bacterium]MDC1304830.1 mechanosensitive ion channel [Salibacteraceae bacterium]